MNWTYRFAAAALVAITFALPVAQAGDKLSMAIVDQLDPPQMMASAGSTKLDPSIVKLLDTEPVSSRESLNLSIINKLDPTPEPDPVEPPAPSPKPKAKIKPGATGTRIVSPNAGSRLLESCQPQPAPKATYPVRSSFWSHPGTGKAGLIDHLLNAPQHTGKWTEAVLQQLSIAQLESLHSDDHERRAKPLAWVSQPRTNRPTIEEQAEQYQAPPKRLKAFNVNDGSRWYVLYEHTDGKCRCVPETGVDYDMPPAAVQQRTYAAPVYSNCPGGRCPVRRG